MIKIIGFVVVCFGAVGLAQLMGMSEEAGLFGAIVGGGCYILNSISK
jgi:hypothetical protein